MRQILGSVILAVGLLAAPQPDTRKAQSLMQAAQSKETIDGDLKAAIDLYRQAVRSAGKDRALAAKALLRVAACQEKQGVAEAKKTYQEILRNYSDQAEAVNIARLKLGVSAGDGPAQLTARQLWNSVDMGNVGSVSPDGRYITYTHWGSGDIRIIDLTTGDTRTLSRGDWEKSDYAYGMNSLFSPDGKQIVFTSFRGREGSLKVTAPAGGGVRTVGGEGEDYGLVTGWLPDGKRVVTVAGDNWGRSDRHILVVDLADGSKKEIAGVPAAVSAQMNITALASPDGNYILFDRRKSAAARDLDIYIVPVAGGEARPLISDLSDESLIAWTPGGSHLVFGSNRGTGPGLYMAAFRDGKLEGEPALLKEGLRGFPMGFDRKGNYYYNAVGGGAMILRVAGFDPAAGKVTGPPRIVPMRRGMGTSRSPIWTPDGRMLAFQRRSSSNEDTGTEFVIADPDTGAEAKVIQANLSLLPGIRFRPDGSAVAQDVGSGPLSALNVNWEKGVLEPFQLVESSDKGNLCSGPGVQIESVKAGIFIADYASNKLWRLTDRSFLQGGVAGGFASPDCAFIAYTVNSSRSIRLFDVASGSERELVSMEEPYHVNPRSIFTPDGKRLLFIRIKNEREAGELWSVPVSGGTPAPTGIAIHNLRYPVLSPDGSRLAFIGGQVSYEAYVVEGLLPTSLRGQR